MSYRNNDGDPRAHTTFEEKEEIARDLLDRLTALMVADQPEGTPACNECAATTLLVALGVLCEKLVAMGEVDETLGVARRLLTMNAAFDPMAADMLRKVAERDMPYLVKHSSDLAKALKDRVCTSRIVRGRLKRR